MYIIFRNEDNKPIAATHTRMGASRACRHYHMACKMEQPKSKSYARYEKIDNYSLYRFGYFILRIVRKQQNKKLEKIKDAEYECRSIRRAQQKKVAALY